MTYFRERARRRCREKTLHFRKFQKQHFCNLTQNRHREDCVYEGEGALLLNTPPLTNKRTPRVWENSKLNANKNLKYPNKGGKVNKHEWKQTGGAITSIEIHPSITCFNRIRLFQISRYLATIPIFSLGILMHSWANGIYRLLSLLDIPWRPQNRRHLNHVPRPCRLALFNRSSGSSPSALQIPDYLSSKTEPSWKKLIWPLVCGTSLFFFIFPPPPRV